MLEDKLSLFGTLCHHEKCGGFGLFVGTLLSLGVVISSLIYYLIFINEICHWACVFYFILYAHWFLLCSLVELWNRLCVILILWYILDNLLLCHTFVCIIGLFGVLSKIYLLLVLESLVHAYLPHVYDMACFTFFDPIYRVNSNKS
jgi:hypothetical protein